MNKKHSNKGTFFLHNFPIGSFCPECSEHLVFAESSFYCRWCGFSKADGIVKEKIFVQTKLFDER